MSIISLIIFMSDKKSKNFSFLKVYLIIEEKTLKTALQI